MVFDRVATIMVIETKRVRLQAEAGERPHLTALDEIGATRLTIPRGASPNGTYGRVQPIANGLRVRGQMRNVGRLWRRPRESFGNLLRNTAL